MQIAQKDNTLFLKCSKDELTKQILDEKSDEQIRDMFIKLNDKLKNNYADYDNMVLLAQYSSADTSLYAINFKVLTKTLIFQEERKSEEHSEDDQKEELEKEIKANDEMQNLHPEDMNQDERKKFIQQFIGNSKVINGDYDKVAFKKNNGHVFLTAKEIENENNLGQYGCIPVIAYNISADSFRAKKTNKLWRKMNGLMLDFQHNPFQAEKFNITESQEKAYKGIKPWTKLLLIGQPIKNTFGGKTTRSFEVEGVFQSNDQFVDNSSDTGRFELSNHTKFTQMGAESDPNDIWKAAAEKGLHGLAITDNSSVQAFSDEMNDYSKYKHLKPLYGVEMNQVPDRPNFVFNPNNINLYSKDTSFVAFDIETTGLSTIHDNIIQLSAVRFGKTLHTRSKGKGKNKKEEKFYTYDVIDGYDHIIRVNQPIPKFIQKLTGISQADSDNSKYSEKEAIQKFLDFVNEYDNTILVGHNVIFDYNFINNKAKENGLSTINNEVIDTLPIARRSIKNARSYNLGKLAKKLKIKLDNAHNSRFDAEATGYVLFALLEILKYGDQTDLVDENAAKASIKKPKYNKATIDIKNGYDLRQYETHGDDIYKESFPSHVDLIAKNQKGIKDLYELISKAHIKHFYFTPRIFKDEILNRRDNGNNFLYGSGNAGSKLYDTLTRYGYEAGLKLVQNDKYDYLEIMSISSLGLDPNNERDFRFYDRYLKDMIKISKVTNTITAIIGSSYYTDKEDQTIFDIIKKKNNDNKDESLKTAEQLKKELKPFLDDDKLIDDLVVQNTIKIANQCEDDLQPIKTKLTPPRIEGADQELTDGAWNKAHELYGKKLPEEVSERIERELKSIINNGYSVIYLTAKKLVDRSRKNGYIVGSRGSVGGSLVAFLTGITEVNSLPPHYRSKYGTYTEFSKDMKYADGFDLPPKKDPTHPDEYLIGDGHNCSYEIFAGVGGKKVPDIDLNFASVIQNEAQLWLKDIFGEKNTFRVGNVGTLASKTARGLVKHYEDEHDVSYTESQVTYFADRIDGLKKTSGQHPAGILIVPEDKDITDFTPYNWPANKPNSTWMTTMFDKNMMHDSLLKMDCLGHDDPSMLHFMQAATGIDPTKLTQAQIQDVVKNLYAYPSRITGTPEFGTNFAKGIVKTAKPKTFADLVQISGISHGINVWEDNAEKLITSGKADIQGVIGSRDKILNDLVDRGYPAIKAHNIVQIVKKSKPITPDIVADLKKLGLPNWYPDSLRKIGYLFPMAHAVAYVLSACRIGYFKLHEPLTFYASWISYHADGLSINDILKNDFNTLAKRAQTIANLDYQSPKDKKKYTSLSMAAEALMCYKRGFGKEQSIKFVKPSLEHSAAHNWMPNNDNGIIYLGFDMMDSVSEAMGNEFVKYREAHNGKMSRNLDDYKEFGMRVPKKAVDSLIKYDLIDKPVGYLNAKEREAEASRKKEARAKKALEKEENWV